MVYFHRVYHGIGKPLCHHQRYETSARADVENALAASRPSAEKHAIRAYFHCAAVLCNGEFLN